MKKAIKIFGIGVIVMLLLAALPAYAEEGIEAEPYIITIEETVHYDYPELDAEADATIWVTGPPDVVYDEMANAIIETEIAIRNAIMDTLYGDGDGDSDGGDNGDRDSNVTITISVTITVKIPGLGEVSITVSVTGPPDEVYDMLEEAVRKAIERLKKLAESLKKKKIPWWAWFICPIGLY